MSIDLLSQLVSAAIRAVGLGLVAFVGLLLFRVRSSAARHATWTVVLAGMLLQIPLGLVAPTVALKALTALPAPIPHPIQTLVVESTRLFAAAAPSNGRSNDTRTAPKGKWGSFTGTLAGIYLLISALLFARMALGSWGLRRILRDARPIPDLGPGIHESALFVVPVSTGCFRAKILLPRAWRNWEAVKLRAVLAHERSHIRRQDWLVRVASHVNVCIFWFHPLAWWMEREIARLAEEACDDVALSEIEDPDEYAATLVDIARTAAVEGGVLNWQVISMAKDSKVLRRVNRILNQRVQVPKPFGRFAWVMLFVCSLPVIYLSAAINLSSKDRNLTIPPHVAVPARAMEGSRRPILQERKSSPGLIAQAAPAQPLGPAQALTPSRSEDSSMAICIVIDNSGSMRDKHAAVMAAARALVKGSKPGDDVCIIDFNDEVFRALPQGEDFTADIGDMEAALTHIDSRGGKAMRDAIWLSIEVEQTAHHDRRAVVLVTEGNDTASRVTQEQLLSKARNSGVRVFCIGLVGEDEPRRAGTARAALSQLAEASGGLDYYPKDLAEVERIASEIVHELRKH